MPLASSFVLSSKKGKEAIVVPVVQNGGYRFAVKKKGLGPDELAKARAGTKASRGANFVCLLSGAPIPGDHIKAEGTAGRMGARLMAAVAEGRRGRAYLDPTAEMEETARQAESEWKPDQELSNDPRNIWCIPYGLSTFADLLTPRQLAALTTFSDLVSEVRGKALAEARDAGMDAGALRLFEGGTGAEAYADAVATYLGLCVSRQANRCSNLNFWDPGGAKVQQVFARQALPMVWDFCEANPFSESSGSFVGQVGYLAKAVEASPANVQLAAATQADAVRDEPARPPWIVATDPPYYDDIGYADLSDFFYVWLRRSLAGVHPDLFRTLLVPKSAELVATPYRFDGSREKARDFFEAGSHDCMARLRAGHDPAYPLTLYYTFKQAETKHDGNAGETTVSTGWETMLAGVVAAGFTVEGTSPVRTELAGNLKKRVAALASSIVLACRPRAEDAPAATRRDFAAALRRELPDAIRHLQAENIAPVDLAQAAIGPDMAVFSRYARVLEADGAPMKVRAALAEINRVLDETLAEAEGDMDADTRFCVAWFEQYGATERAYGEAEVLFTAKNTSFKELEEAGVIADGSGKVRLKRREELEPG